MAYGPSYNDLFRRAAVYVDKVLKGAKPAHLPVEQPTKFEFIINLKAAIGVGHNNDASKLMCGRPATCRPDAFRSNTERFFPLLEEEKQILLKLYPPTWKGAQTN